MKVIVSCKFLTVLLILLFLPVKNSLVAQTDTLYYLDSIRVDAPYVFAAEMEGKLLNLSDDTLTFDYSGKIFSIPTNKITNLEVVVGISGNTWNGALYGALAGGITLGTIAAISNSGEEKGWVYFPPTVAFLGGFITGGLVGSIFGMVVGSQTKSPDWQKVDLQNIEFVKIPRFSYSNQSDKPEPPPGKSPENKNRIKNKPHKKENTIIPQNQKSDNNDKWHLSVSFGTNSSGPASNIETAVRNNGWGDPKPIIGLFHIEGYEQRPETKTGFGEIGIPWSLELTYKVSKIFDAGLLTSNNPIGLTKGYRSETKSELNIEYSSWVFSAFLQIKPADNVKIGLGPLLCSNKIHESVLSNSIKTQFGALILFRFVYPASAPLYAKFDFQYRLLPATSFGPINLSSGSEIALQKFEADFSHAFIGLGIGVGF